MTHHNTLQDRARKARIREREFRDSSRRLRKLDAITDEQINTLKQIKASEAASKPVLASNVPDWRDLREMGAVREVDGNLVLSSIGAQVAAHEA